MGQPSYPVVAIICKDVMEELEETAIKLTSVSKNILKRYVDNSFCIIKKNAVAPFHDSF